MTERGVDCSHDRRFPNICLGLFSDPARPFPSLFQYTPSLPFYLLDAQRSSGHNTAFMALTQSARLPGPSWDEEVVPALRKREFQSLAYVYSIHHSIHHHCSIGLENESRTLARRMSAISMSSNADDNPLVTFANSAAAAAFVDSGPIQNQQQNNYQQQAVPSGSSSSSQRPRPGYQYHQHTPSDHPTSTPSTSTRVNGVQSARKPVATTSFHRSRTYSAVDNSLQMNGSARLPRRINTNTSTTVTPSRSPRLPDAKPTRIPKASRGPPGSVSSAGSPPPTPFLNGASMSGVSHSSATPTPTQTPNPAAFYGPDIRAYHFPTSHSSHANLGPSQPSRIINEPAPFNTASSSTSSIYNIHEVGESIDDFGSHRPRASRASVDSNSDSERPFEHWYRGEVSRNGGVGELRVGRRQEMLEIANYGHAINNKRKAIANRKAALLALEERRAMGIPRKRADSLAGIGARMRERGSLYLDDIIDQAEFGDHVGRVLDEDPLTDLESGDGSDVASVSTRGGRRQWRYSNHNTDYDFIPGVGDLTVSTAATTTATSGYTESPPQSPPTSYEHEVVRGDTPTQFAAPTQHQSRTTTPTHRSKSRQGSSSSRIPTLSSERRSSESRTSTPTQQSTKPQSQQQPGVVDLTPTPSSLPLPSSPLLQPPSTPSSTGNKRGISPGPHSATTPGSTPSSKKARTGAGPKSAVKSKPKSAMKKSPPNNKPPEDPRRSVAHYPSPGGEGDDDGMDMADAIPSWTQPKPREGNWDDVRGLLFSFVKCYLCGASIPIPLSILSSLCSFRPGFGGCAHSFEIFSI